MHKSTDTAWLQQLHDRKSDTKHTEGGHPGEKGLYCPPHPGVPEPCPAQLGNTSSTLPGMLWGCLPPQKPGTAPRRWSDSYVWWQLLATVKHEVTWALILLQEETWLSARTWVSLDNIYFQPFDLKDAAQSWRQLFLITAKGSHLLFFHIHSLPPERRRGWKYQECRTGKHLLGCSICGRHLPAGVMEHLFISLLGERERRGKGGSVSVSLLEQFCERAHALLIHSLAKRWQRSRNAEAGL